jgi:hypothetical protein
MGEAVDEASRKLDRAQGHARSSTPGGSSERLRCTAGGIDRYIGTRTTATAECYDLARARRIVRAAGRSPADRVEVLERARRVENTRDPARLGRVKRLRRSRERGGMKRGGMKRGGRGSSIAGK